MWQKIKSFLFHNTTTRQTVVKNTIWLSVSNVGGRLLRAIIVIYAARVLGAAGWGIFSYAISLVAVITVFTDMGINSILTREIARSSDKEKNLQILSTSFIMKIVLLVAGIFVVLVIGPHFTREAAVKAILPITVFVLTFDTIREFGSSLIRAVEKMELEAGIYLLTNVAIVTFGFVFLHFSKSVESFTYSYAAGTAVGMIVTLFFLKDKIRDITSHFSKKIIGFVLLSAWPFTISAVMGLLLTNTDILIIGWFKSAKDVGLYSAPLRIVQVIYVLPAILATTVLPTLSRLAGKDDGKFRIIMERALTVLFLVAIPTAAGAVILGPQIVQFVFGSEYLPAALSFQILMLTLIVDFPATLFANTMFAYNKQKYLVVFATIGGTLNVIFDLFFIPRFGITGSAIATFAAQVISNVYLWRAMKKINYFTMMPHLKKIIPAAAVMSLFAWILSQIGAPVLITIAASIFAYFGTLIALKEPLVDEIKLTVQGDA